VPRLIFSFDSLGPAAFRFAAEVAGGMADIFHFFFGWLGFGGDESSNDDTPQTRDFDMAYGADEDAASPSPPLLGNQTCFFPLNSTLKLVNGSLYLEDTPSCGDIPLLILLAVLFVIILLAFAGGGGSGGVGSRSLKSAPPAPPPSKSYMKAARAKAAANSRAVPMV
jgi:hypothetical protein